MESTHKGIRDERRWRRCWGKQLADVFEHLYVTPQAFRSLHIQTRERKRTKWEKEGEEQTEIEIKCWTKENEDSWNTKRAAKKEGLKENVEHMKKDVKNQLFILRMKILLFANSF